MFFFLFFFLVSTASKWYRSFIRTIVNTASSSSSFAPFQLMLRGATAPIADLAPGWEAVLTSDAGGEVYYWNK